MKKTFSADHRQIANKIGLYIYIIVNPYMNIIPQINSYVAEKMERNIIHPWYHPARHMYWALVGTANKSLAGIYSSIEARWSILPKIPLFPCLLPLLPCICQCLIYLDYIQNPLPIIPIIVPSTALYVLNLHTGLFPSIVHSVALRHILTEQFYVQYLPYCHKAVPPAVVNSIY